MTKGIEQTISLEHQSVALSQALQGLVNQTPVNPWTEAGRHLKAVVDQLGPPGLSPTQQLSALHGAVRTLKHLVTAYHEAGHVLAYHALTPRDRVQLGEVRFGHSAERGVEAGMTYTLIAEPWWPDPQERGEVVRELACVLAGKDAEPILEGGVELSGSDQDDQREAADLLEVLPEGERALARRQAQGLLRNLSLDTRVPPLAAQLYEHWVGGDTAIPIEELRPFLVPVEAAR